MNLDHHQALHAVRDLALRVRSAPLAGLDISVHPPFTDLRTVQSVIEPDTAPIALGAQNCSDQDVGAFTGEVSPVMLAKLHVEYVIVGHSERRRLFGETDEVVAAKVQAVVRNGMVPICCVGETERERADASTEDRLEQQVRDALGGLPPETAARTVIAYEPVWAIGTGKAATPDDAQVACAWIRDVVRRSYRADVADQVRIQYGGSVTEDNMGLFAGCPDIDGALVGGASLDPARFVGIVQAALQSPA